MWSGGSPVSWSEICAANTVTTQTSPLGRSAFGLIVKVVGPPVTTVSTGFRVLLGQTIWNQFPATFTGSLKVMAILVLLAGCSAPSAGGVFGTKGGWATAPA